MKKRLLSLLLVLCMVLAALASTAAAETGTYYRLKSSVYTSNPQSVMEDGEDFDTLEELLSTLKAGQYQQGQSMLTISTAHPITIEFEVKRSCDIVFSDKIIVAPSSAKAEIEAAGLHNSAYVIYNESAEGVTFTRVGGHYMNYAYELVFEKGIEVYSGSKLKIENYKNNAGPFDITLKDDVEVSGEFVMGSQSNKSNVVFEPDASLIVNQTGACELGRYNYTGGSEEEPMIQNAGTLSLGGSGTTDVQKKFSPTMTSAGTAIANTETGKLTVQLGEIKTTSEKKPLIVNDGTMKVEHTAVNKRSILSFTASGTVIENTGTLDLHNGAFTTTSETAPVIDMQGGSMTLNAATGVANEIPLNLTAENAAAETPLVTLAAGTTYTAADGTTTTLTNGGTITKDDTATEPGGSGLVVTPNPEPEPEPEPEKPVQKPVVFPGILGELPFTDVAFNADFFEAVQYVYASGLMMGTAPDKFDPNATLTRAMIWTVLARMSGVDTETDANQPWWAKARTWAMDQGITDGTYPQRAVTRLELVTMLWRFYNSPGAAVDVTGVGNVPDWGLEALRWAAQYGLIDVAGWKQPATRAETAVAIYKA